MVLMKTVPLKGRHLLEHSKTIPYIYIEILWLKCQVAFNTALKRHSPACRDCIIILAQFSSLFGGEILRLILI